ncbi:MAG: YgfZ/GcvT domain-containing protein [Acidimicrobiales bacterium]
MTRPAGELSLEEGYDALRHGCGARRLDRDVVLVTGGDAAAYLQGQVSQDIAVLAVGETADALLLEPDGKLSALVRITRVGDDRYALDVDTGFGDTVTERLRRFRLRTKVEIEEVSWPCLALRGPAATSVARAATSAAPAAGHDGPWLLAFAWNGVSGVDLLGPGADSVIGTGDLAGTDGPATGSDPAALGALQWCGAEPWESVRIEAGIPALGRELGPKTIPAEVPGLVERAVSFTKGCFTGQELVARIDARGSRVPRLLRGLVATEDGTTAYGPGSAAVADRMAQLDRLARSELVVDGRDKPVGRVTSAGWCPGAGGVAALGYVHRSVAVGEIVRAVVSSGEGTPAPDAAASRDPRRGVVLEVRGLPL